MLFRSPSTEGPAPVDQGGDGIPRRQTRRCARSRYDNGRCGTGRRVIEYRAASIRPDRSASRPIRGDLIPGVVPCIPAQGGSPGGTRRIPSRQSYDKGENPAGITKGRLRDWRNVTATIISVNLKPANGHASFGHDILAARGWIDGETGDFTAANDTLDGGVARRAWFEFTGGFRFHVRGYWRGSMGKTL